jgi:hypothetical protein
MITHSTLSALIQGLPLKYFDHLPEPWPAMARRISRVMQSGPDYAAALRTAFDQATPQELEALKKTFTISWDVVQIPKLTYRQRELLIALRMVKVASLSQISAIVSQDRRNTARRLETLEKKYFVERIMQPNGTHYFAKEYRSHRDLNRAIGLFLDYVCAKLDVKRVFLEDLTLDATYTIYTSYTINTQVHNLHNLHSSTLLPHPRP